MAHGLNSVFRHLRQLLAGGPGDQITDGQLLERFADHHEEAAFAALMQRHAPMVLNVCKRLLARDQDVEDAFQATFLVLARRAAGLERRASVGGWLHAVACQTSLKARFLATRRQQREQPLMNEPSHGAASEATWDDLKPVLDEELGRLPDKYRAPLVLCYLEGKSNEEAARQLQWPTGTVKGRLARARDLLRTRLSRRGVTLSAAGLATLFETPAASATVPVALMDNTLRSALLFAAGESVAAGSVSTLTEGVLQTMFVTKMKVAAVLALLVACVIGLGAWGYHSLGLAGLSTTGVVVPLNEKPAVEPNQLAAAQLGKTGLIAQFRPMVSRLAPGDALPVALHFAGATGPITNDQGPNFDRMGTVRSLSFKFTTVNGVVELKAGAFDLPEQPTMISVGRPMYFQPTFFFTLTRDGLTLSYGSWLHAPAKWADGKKAPLDVAGIASLQLSGTVLLDKAEPLPFTCGPIKIELGAKGVQPRAQLEEAARAALKKQLNLDPKESPMIRENNAGQRLFYFRGQGQGKWNFSENIVALAPSGAVQGNVEVRERSNCVARGTLVAGEFGPLPIEQVSIGDRLWGYDPARREKTLVTVRFIRSAPSDETLLFAGSLRVTAQHPVFVNDDWRWAGTIRPQDTLLAQDLTRHAAGVPVQLHEHTEVYDLTVDGPHTYFAGGFLVHNKDRGYSPDLDDPWYLLWPELLPAKNRE